MFEMKVVGRTTPREVMVASKDRCIVADEYVTIQDEATHNPVGEVVETKSYPSIERSTFTAESGIYQSLEEAGWTKGIVHVARVKMLDELDIPITPESEVKIPVFTDIEEMLVPVSPNKGLVLGVVRGSEKIHDMLPIPLRRLMPMYDRVRGITDQQGVPFILSHYKFRDYPHLGLFGGTGSGKTHGLRVVCEELMRFSLPGIAFDPHYELNFHHAIKGLQSEFCDDFSHKHEIFQVGENVGINFTDLSTDELVSMIQFVGDISEPMIGALNALHQRNDSFHTLIKRVNEIKTVFINMEKPKRDRDSVDHDAAIQYERYKDKIAGAPTLQALSWRLEALEKSKVFDCDIHLVEAAMLKRKLAVIRGDNKSLRMLSAYLCRKMYGKRREYRDWSQKKMQRDANIPMPKAFPPFFIILDESHIFAPEGERTTPTKAVLREIAQEARKYGVFLVLGTQRPALLDKTITSMLNTKVIFRTSIESDMKMIQTETNLNAEQVARLPDMPTGNAFIASATLKKTFYIRFRSTKTESPHEGHPFDELDQFDDSGRIQDVLSVHLPLSQVLLPKKHTSICDSMGRLLTNAEIFEQLDEMVRLKKVKIEESAFGVTYRPI